MLETRRVAIGAEPAWPTAGAAAVAMCLDDHSEDQVEEEEVADHQEGNERTVPRLIVQHHDIREVGGGQADEQVPDGLVDVANSAEVVCAPRS